MSLFAGFVGEQNRRSLTSEQLSHMSSESAAAAVGFAPRSGFDVELQFSTFGAQYQKC